MQMTIIPSDSTVIIDGFSFSGINMSSIDPSIHAVQWYESYGELEIKNVLTGKMVENKSIDSISIFDNVINQFNVLKAEHEAMNEALNDIQNVYVDGSITSEQIQSV